MRSYNISVEKAGFKMKFTNVSKDRFTSIRDRYLAKGFNVEVW